MTEAVVRLWLKVADATALTARETLQRSLGYGRVVEDVARSEVWAFAWEEAVDAEAVLARLARDTNLLLNPNKHHLEIATGEATLRPRGNVWVLAWTPGDGSDMADTLTRHGLVEGSPPGVRRGRLWELGLAGEPAERRRLAEEIAVARERKRGLLTNPHVADALVFPSPPGVREVSRALFGADSVARVG